VKNIKHSTKKRMAPRIVDHEKTFYNEVYRDMGSLRINHINDGYLLKFALDWVDWVLDPKNDCLTLEEFYSWKRIHSTTVARWMERCEELKEAHAFVKEYLYIKRDKGAIQRKYDAGYIKYTMPNYNEDFKKLEEWRAKLSDKIGNAGNVQYVYMDKF